MLLTCKFPRCLMLAIFFLIWSSSVNAQSIPDNTAGGDLKNLAVVVHTAKRDLLDDFNNALGDIGNSILGGGSSSHSGSSSSSSSNSSLLNGIGNLLKDGTSFINTVSSLLNGNASVISILGSLLTGTTNLTALATPALFLGIGIGDGVVTGLNMTTAQQAAVYVNNAVAASGASDTGLNVVAQNLGKGLSSVVIPVVVDSGGNITQLLSGLDLPALVEGAGTGTADGISTSLKPVLGTSVFDVPEGQELLNDTAGGIAYSFARGLSSEATQWGMGFLGIGNQSVAPKRASRSTLDDTRRHDIQFSKRYLVTMLKTFGSPKSRRADSDVPMADGSKTDTMVTDLAQTALSTLTCQGVGVMISVINGASKKTGFKLDTSNMTLPDINFAVTNQGNHFRVELDPMTVTVNGVTVDNLVKFIAVHVVLILLAFLAIFPSILALEALKGLSLVIGQQISPTKLNLWLNILQLVALPLFALIGLILGVLAGGNSKHFRTTHGELGLALVIISFISSITSFFRRRGEAKSNDTGHPHPRTSVGLVDSLVTAVVLILTLFAWGTGLEDLRSLSLCIVDQVSMSVVAMVANIFNWLWDAAIAIKAIEWWLMRRAGGKGNSGQRQEHNREKLSEGKEKAQYYGHDDADRESQRSLGNFASAQSLSVHSKGDIPSPSSSQKKAGPSLRKWL